MLASKIHIRSYSQHMKVLRMCEQRQYKSMQLRNTDISTSQQIIWETPT